MERLLNSILPVESPNELPNIVVIFADDLGLGGYRCLSWRCAQNTGHRSVGQWRRSHLINLTRGENWMKSGLGPDLATRKNRKHRQVMLSCFLLWEVRFYFWLRHCSSVWWATNLEYLGCNRKITLGVSIEERRGNHEFHRGQGTN